MKIRFLTPIILTFMLAAAAFAQGGKAEPNRISFAKGKTTATVTGTIRVTSRPSTSLARVRGRL